MVHTFHIKRDDQIHPLVSGNKWRKLKLHFQHEHLHLHPGIVTCGGPWSNHLIATAAAGQIYKIPTIGLVRGQHHRFINPIIKHCQYLGMDIHFLPNNVFNLLQSEPEAVLSDLNFSDHLYIPMGGDDENGRNGSKEIVTEVLAHGMRPKLWVVAAGTGATAAGMLAAIDYPCDFLLFPAIKKESVVEALQYKLSQVSSKARLMIMPEHRCTFGRVDQQLIDFVRSFKNQTNILLDPIYNGKMVEELFNLKMDKAMEDTLVYHSGGILGWKGVVHKWQDRTDMSFIDM